MNTFDTNSCEYRQRGAALAVSLILLLVMTIVGIAAMNGARLEISMAGIMLDEETALRRSERTLMVAEDIVANLSDTHEFGTEGDAYYGPNDDLDTSTTDWSSLVSMAPPTVEGDLIEDDEDDDRIVIQHLGQHPLPGESLDEAGCTPETCTHIYRITTRSATGGKAVRIVEAMYTRKEAPPAAAPPEGVGE